MAQSHRETRGRQGKCQWFITTPAVLHAKADNPEYSFPTGKQIQVHMDASLLTSSAPDQLRVDQTAGRAMSGTHVQCVAMRPGLTTGLSSAWYSCQPRVPIDNTVGWSAVKKLDVCKLQDATMQAKLQSSLSESGR